MAIQQNTKLCLDAAVGNLAAGTEIRNILNVVEGGAASVTWTVGAEANNVIVVNMQAKDDQGANVAQKVALPVLICTDTDGSPSATGTEDYTIAAGTTGKVFQVLADAALIVVTDAAGSADISLTNSGAATSYLAAVLPGGKLSFSAAVTHGA